MATAVSTEQICTVCETTFASEAALRTDMCRARCKRGLAGRFAADTQSPECEKCFVTRARAVQHGDNTRCKHAMMSGGQTGRSFFFCLHHCVADGSA